MNDKSNISSLCRIKVNKMLSSLNLNNNIFVPKYTLINKNEEKYSLSKEKSSKSIHSNILKNNNSNIKESKNKIIIETTEDNYTKQPIDFIINHGVLVYQRNLKGEEIINLGINNEYLRNNNFKVDKNGTKQSFSNDKNKYIKSNNSKKCLFSINDMLSLNNKNKNYSYFRNNGFNTKNLNSTLNSNSSVNSMNINNIKYIGNKNKFNKAHTQLNINNKKNIINYVRKKNNYNENTFHIIRKKRINQPTNNDENKTLNNKTDIRDTCKFNTKIKISPKKQKHNFIINTNFKILKLIHSLHITKNFYLKKYFKIFSSSISKKLNNFINNQKNEIDTNKVINNNEKNIIYNQENNKSNCILVNKTLSPNTTNKYELLNNSNKNLNLLISKNLRFFSKDKNNGNNKDENRSERRSSELFRNSKSLQKKYEQIIRRKKKQKTLAFSNRYRDINSPGIEKDYFSDINKTNSFSNLYDNNSVNSFQLKNNYHYINQLYTENSLDNENNKENKNNNIISNINVNDNLDENKSVKHNKKNPIKLVKNNEKSNIRFNKYIKYNNKRKKNNSYNHFENNYNSMNENNNLKKYSMNINNKKNSNNNSVNNNNKNKNIFKKVFIHKRKNYFLEDKNILKIKEKINKRNNTYINDNYYYNFKNKYIAFLIKNICTRDRRIFVHINYIPLFLSSYKINCRKYNINLLRVENVYNYEYITNKNKIKRKNEFEKKLSLIREEDEKSKYFNSSKSSIKLEEDMNSNKKKDNNIRLTKNIKEKIPHLAIIVNLLQKYYCKYHENKKKKFIFYLKIISLVESINKIIQNKVKDNIFIKYIKKIIEERNKLKKGDLFNCKNDKNIECDKK